MDKPTQEIFKTVADSALAMLPARTVVIILASVPVTTGGSNLHYIANGDRGDIINVLRAYIAASDSRN